MREQGVRRGLQVTEADAKCFRNRSIALVLGFHGLPTVYRQTRPFFQPAGELIGFDLRNKVGHGENIALVVVVFPLIDSFSDKLLRLSKRTAANFPNLTEGKTLKVHAPSLEVADLNGQALLLELHAGPAELSWVR